jgi:serine/threonine protein phosphatase PrpC
MLTTAMLSLQGLRNSNQDRILVVRPVTGPGDGGSDQIIAAVADGLGGMFAGDKAAEIAVEAVRESADELFAAMMRDFNDAADFLVATFQRANDRIRAYADAQGKPGGVGTTLTLWVASGSRCLCVVNAGVTGTRFASDYH